jgi:hypothetical protein
MTLYPVVSVPFSSLMSLTSVLTVLLLSVKALRLSDRAKKGVKSDIDCSEMDGRL